MRYVILKEFLKFKLAYLAFLLAILFCMAWIFFDIRGGFGKFGASGYTLQVLFTKKFSFNHLDLLNIAFALTIAVCSMFFERLGGRIRVQFHYPHSYTRNALTLTLVPLCFLFVTYVLELVVLFALFLVYFPSEIAGSLISTLIYSCAFGMGAFCLAQAAVIEPNLSRVVANVLSLVAMGYIYYKFNPDFSSSMYYQNEILWAYMAIFWAFALFSLTLALNNYKKGYIK